MHNIFDGFPLRGYIEPFQGSMPFLAKKRAAKQPDEVSG